MMEPLNQQIRELPPHRDDEHANAMEHLRRELQELREMKVRRQEEDNECYAASSLQAKERLEAAWLEKLMPLSGEVSSVTMACSDSKAKIDMMLDEVQALRQLHAHSTSGISQHSAHDLDSIKQDIRHLADLSDSNKGTAERVKLGLEGLQEEVKVFETKMNFALRDAIEQHKLPQVLTDLDTLQRQVASLQDPTSSLFQSRGTEPGVRHDVATSILEELRKLAEQTEQGGRMATDMLNRVNERGPEQHSVRSSQHRESEAFNSKLDELQRQIALYRSESQKEWRDQAQPIIEELRRLHNLPINQGDIVSGVLQEVEALSRQVIATNNQSPDLLAQQETMVAPITQGLDGLMTLSQQCQEKVNSVVDQMDGFRQEMQSSQVVSRDFVTHQALRDELGAVKKSAAEGHKFAETMVGEVDGLRQDLKKMNDVNLETMQQHPNIAGLQASEERELQAYEQVLLRLDELTEQLQTFENAFAGPDALTSPVLIPAE